MGSVWLVACGSARCRVPRVAAVEVARCCLNLRERCLVLRCMLCSSVSLGVGERYSSRSGSVIDGPAQVDCSERWEMGLGDGKQVDAVLEVMRGS